jgi:thymidylate synthase (FAD)
MSMSDSETTQTLRHTNPGAEKWLDTPIQCLDQGYIMLKDYMGGDESIVQSARVSYGRGTKKGSTDRALISYLMRHRHTTPLEMVEFKFLVKLPIFVARQWIRHRTANVNEISARYSVMEDEFFVPDDEAVRFQSQTNMQGSSADEVPPELAAHVMSLIQDGAARAYGEYTEMVEQDIARELARVHLPVSLYTQWYWKIDLHNLLHFLSLRMDHHAQREIRLYAEAMAQIVRDAMPWTWEAFEEYTIGSLSLGKSEREIVGMLLRGETVSEMPDMIATGGRRREFEDKLRELGVDPDAVLPPVEK